MNVLVAGGAGFIGSHLCRLLLDNGHHVVCLDNLVTGRARNLAGLQGAPGFDMVRHDVCQPLPALPRPDLIFQLASPASPPGYERLPIETLRVNSEGTLRLLELAAASSATFVLASTSEVYGDPLVHPQREDYRGNVSPVGPRSMYDEGKRFGEAATMAFVRSRALDARIVRIFNTYGPNSDPDDGRLVPNFVVQALRGEPLTIYGDGTQTRSLCYVSDLVRGLLLAATAPGARGEVINLGNPEEHTILEFAQLIRAAARSSSELTFVDYAVGDDPKQRRPDISRARRLLGWEPIVSLSDGIERTIE
ncbi:MAG: NAD-dependent epimerase/dehydratase family protein, partial [Tepidiformaceae bacterium]